MLVLVPIFAFGDVFPISVTGEVTAFQETWTPMGNGVTVYMKTLNGGDNALSIYYLGIPEGIKVGHSYRISVGWWWALISVEEITP